MNFGVFLIVICAGLYFLFIVGMADENYRLAAAAIVTGALLMSIAVPMVG